MTMQPAPCPPTCRTSHWLLRTGLSFALLVSVAVEALAQDKLLITTEEATPLSMVKDDAKVIYGGAADKVHEMLRRSHIPYTMQATTWNRAIELARAQVNTCVFSTARTPDRESGFSWIGPIAKGDWAIIGTVEKKGRVTQLTQVKGSPIGVYTGDAVGEYLVHRGYHIMTSYGDEITIRNLLIGRLDYWASDATSAAATIIRDGLQNKLNILFTFASSDYYLACNPKTSGDIIAKLKEKLTEIRDDGTYARIDAKYSSGP